MDEGAGQTLPNLLHRNFSAPPASHFLSLRVLLRSVFFHSSYFPALPSLPPVPNPPLFQWFLWCLNRCVRFHADGKGCFQHLSSGDIFSPPLPSSSNSSLSRKEVYFSGVINLWEQLTQARLSTALQRLDLGPLPPAPTPLQNAFRWGEPLLIIHWDWEIVSFWTYYSYVMLLIRYTVFELMCSHTAIPL